jgi:thiol-disulfide isomerase/thioredoxin
LRIGGVGSVLALALAACGQSPVSGPADGGQAAPPAATAPADAPQVGIDRSRAGTPAPDVPLETGPDGNTETLADIVRAHRGPVLVNLWATWCTPCIKELPTLDRLQAEAGPALKVVPISQDMEGWRVVTPAFTPERYPHLATRLDSQMAFGSALDLRGLPVTILYDADAREVWRYNGDKDWAGTEARALIAEASAPAAG